MLFRSPFLLRPYDDRGADLVSPSDAALDALTTPFQPWRMP